MKVKKYFLAIPKPKSENFQGEILKVYLNLKVSENFQGEILVKIKIKQIIW